MRMVNAARLMATAMLSAASAVPLAAAPVAMPANAAAGANDWWKKAVIYELYPRSFADSNNDGIGDIKGITGRLDYLADLGIDAIWMTPMFPSPQADFGYDVADYNGVDPQFGTVADVDALIAKGKDRGVKLILDFVINHSSDQHSWFRQSRASRDNPYRDFYVWRDPKPDGSPPNNWTSLFGGSAWDKDPKTGQYYYHFFYPQQPDLNWRNPKVEKAMFDAAEWWLKRGVYGYRLDAVGTMFERADLKDNPPAPGTDAFGLPEQNRINNTEQPEMHIALQRLRQQVIDRYPGRVLIGETYVATAPELTRFYGAHNDELQMPMFLSLIGVQPITAGALRPRIEAVENNPVGGWPTFALNNHDQRRAPSRYTLPPGTSSDDMAKITGAMLLTLRGTPILYYGEELGMVNNDPQRVEDVQDIIGKKGWPKEKGRDGERTPMQWDASTNAGFNKGARPWLPVAPDFTTRNVAVEKDDPASVLSLYRTLIAERRINPALAGDMAMVDRANPDVLSYVRSGGGKRVLTLLNFSANAADVPLARAGGGKTGRIIVQNRASIDGTTIHIAPLGVMVVELS
ncbi:glycoside hydrolase family 13 protein [Sphingomonas crusticola]|uniref:glycoside hydrolase family 13 protein n=1 Tax=Sphingomonas crusticola TaxID=1697973 RepID=UPI001F07A92A|nr:alpha-glucosidase [Sphingomonas crusticola]